MPLQTKFKAFAVTAALSGALATPAYAETFHLLCNGVGASTTAQTTVGNASASNGVWVQGSETTYSRQRTTERLTVEIDGDSGRIQVPAAILPPINSGGKNGWWQLDQLDVGESEIVGRFSLNLMNKPRMRIDRRTGLISIKGFAGLAFDGKCNTFDPDPAARQF